MSDTRVDAIDSRRSSRLVQETVAGWYQGVVTVGVEFVECVSLLSALDIIEGARLQRAGFVLDVYQASGLSAFGPVYDGRRAHLGVLVEQFADRILLIDGVHRARAAQLAGFDRLLATVIRAEGPRAFLPHLSRLADVIAAEKPLSPKFANDRPLEFRPADEWIASWEKSIEEYR